MAEWIDPMKETVQGVWIEEYYKPEQEALKKAAQAAQAEPPKEEALHLQILDHYKGRQCRRE
jgi:hypothetical protein